MGRISRKVAGFRPGDRAGFARPPLLGRRTDALTVLLIVDNCKTCTSEYSKRLPPVAFSQLLSAPNSFSAGALPLTPPGELTAFPRPHRWFKGDPTSKRKGRGSGGEE